MLTANSTLQDTSAQPTHLFTQTPSHTEPALSQIGSVSNISPKSGRDNKQMLLWASIISIVLLIGVFLVLYADQPAAGATAIAQTDGMVQVYVPEGDFEMGSGDDDLDAQDDEKPRHTVYLDAFWIDQTEVTNAMFADFVAKTAHQTDAEKEGSGWACLPDSESGVNCGYVDGADWQHPQGPESNLDGLDNYPVIQVSWNDATTYCAWAERRLPTEAEWEKAAGGTLTEEGSRKYPWGNDAPSGERVNFCDENCPFGHQDSSINDGYSRTSPVGNYPAGASPYGAFDMAGNVWEWTSDSYDSNYYASSHRQNPTGPSPSETKVIRGGSWVVTAPYIRVRFRDGFVADDRGELFGFRCARSP